MAGERGLKVDTDKFDELMEDQRRRARAASAKDSVSIMEKVSAEALPKTEDVHKYQTESCDSRIVAFVDNEGLNKQGQIEAGREVGIVLDKTCFYAEAGGQVGDCGRLESKKGKFVVDATTRIADCVIHKGRLAEGTLAVGDEIKAIVGKDRDAIKKNHTATHLLQWALQHVIGSTVMQQGSLVGADYLRFDFTCPAAPTERQLSEVENLVRQKIAEDHPVTSKIMPRTKAEKLGAMALFGEKYGNEVRVVAIGAQREDELNQAFSREFCGGTHVDRLGTIGGFKIIKEESISAGVRRITALTGAALAEHLDRRSEIVERLSQMLKVSAESLPERVEQLLKENKKLAKELKSASRTSGADVMAEAKQLLKKAEKLGPTSLVTGRLSAASVEQARAAIDMLKKKAKSAAIVFGFDENGKAILLAGLTDDLVKKGLKSGDIVKTIAPIIAGGGGGRAHMAQAGGQKPEKIDDALAKAAELLREKIGSH
jgi:alanyl-tRNA synthetase